jgi:RecB family exonuclease
MDRAAGIIKKEIANQNVFFVFPSDVAANLWARRAGEFSGQRSLALDRFMAWDHFKERAVLAQAPGKEPVSSVIRKLFVEHLIKRNAGEKFLRALIPREYAESGGVFISSITALLPALDYWDRRAQKAGGGADGEDRDLVLIKTAYAAFLEEHGLFEPAWQELTIRDTSHKYYIFFPEAMEDYDEYAELLENNAAFVIVRLKSAGNQSAGGPPRLNWYTSVRAEIRALVPEIRRLHEARGIPYEDMAVNVPQLEELAPYLGRELFLYDIPFRLGAGKPLAEYGAGRLFSLIQKCAADDFSFASLKSLLLNIHLPWARPDYHQKLISFGIAHNCVSTYHENGRKKDVWQEAFRISSREELLRQYYEELKKELLAITGAKTFRDIRRHYFAFRKASLDMSRCGAENNDVLARCIEELSALIRIEAEYPGLGPESPFAFFVSLLGETTYVPNQKREGVHIFPYRVAAAAPFRCHFVINASQSAASVVYRPLGFLRQDKRQRMGLEDTDASGAFFSLYRPPSPAEQDPPAEEGVCYSASAEALTGPAIPHCFFGGAEPRTPRGDDLFHQEKNWWAGGGAGGRQDFPPRLFPVQREGFQNWSAPLREGRAGRFSLLKGKFPPSWPFLSSLEKKVRETQWTSEETGVKPRLRVSATGLTGFFACPAAWFFHQILGIEEYSLEAELLSDMSLGSLYHEILGKLFQEIRRRDLRFLPEHLAAYRAWAKTLTDDAVQRFRPFQGPLAAPLLSAQAPAVFSRIAGLLETEARYFPRYAVAGLEQEIDRPCEVDGLPLLLIGRLDRVSVSEDDDPVIIDYKLTYMPSKTESMAGEDGDIANHQMAMYVKLYEENRGVKTGGAFFVSIRKNDIGAIIGKPLQKRGADREEFQPTLEALDNSIRRFAGAVGRLEFAPPRIDWNVCVNCRYKTICRTTYSLNAGSQGAGTSGAEEDR